MEQNLQTLKSTPVTATTTEAERILGTIIFRTRLAKGWNGYDRRTQDLAVQTWFEILNTEKIPPAAYDELYRRACSFQAAVIQSGREAPEMSAQLMLACWIGENGLLAEIKRHEIEARNRLPETAKSQCVRCFGTGMEYVYSASGERLGSRPGCKHEALKPGEWLWKKNRKDPN
jgi:hypothetical protein